MRVSIFSESFKNNKNTTTNLLALVWLVNGFFCKILMLTPRHQEIVATILGKQFSGEITIVIGILETFMAVWIFIQFSKRLNAVIQIFLILLMNIIEFIMTPHLLLWGRFNMLFAIIFIIFIYSNAFKIQNNN